MKKCSLIILILFATWNCFAQAEAQKAFSEGVELLKAQDYKAAELKFDTAIQKGAVTNGIKMSLIYKGLSLNGQGKYGQAIPCFKRAIQLDTTDAASYADLALAYTYKNVYDTAIAVYKQILYMDSNSKSAQTAYYYMGRIYSLTNRHEYAIKCFDKLISLAPTDAEAYYLRGTTKNYLLDTEGSIADLSKAIELRPNYMEAYANRGVQKVNALPVEERKGIKDKCYEDICADLLKAKQLGDTAVDDMIYIFCQKCK